MSEKISKHIFKRGKVIKKPTDSLNNDHIKFFGPLPTTNNAHRKLRRLHSRKLKYQ